MERDTRSDLLKLTALDADDLRVISAHLQDAVMRVGDMRYLPADKRFAIVVNRFDWDSAGSGGRTGFSRRRSAVHFDRVLDIKVSNIRQNVPDAVLSLLAVEFEPTDLPSGHITLVFSGGGAIRLGVECIEAAMADLGPVWATASRPDHQTVDEAQEG
jgi:hypothetical protein